MTRIQHSQGCRGPWLAGVALSALCALAPLGAAPGAAQTVQPSAPEQATFAQVAEAAAQSVVSVTAWGAAPEVPRRDLGAGDDALREFLRRFGNGDQPMPELALPGPAPAVEPVHVAGAGFVAGPEGLIVTADALVSEADRIEVTWTDGRVEEAEIVGRDEQTGIALLRVEGEPLPGLEWGTSREIGLGEGLLSVGRTEDFGSVLSTGSLSARSADGERLLIDDAPAPALVGAPVLDREGRIIAVRAAADDAAAQTGGTVALAAEVARDVVDELARSGAVARGYLGVQIQPVTADIAAALGLDRPDGVLVAGVQPDTPAAAAGLQEGDVILSLDGAAVTEPQALSRAVARHEPDDQVQLQVWRSEGEVELTATLAALPSQTAAGGASDAPTAGTLVPELGLTLGAMTPDLREEWDLDQTAEGVAVLSVDDPSRSDLQQGDVIVSVHGTSVETVEEVQEAVEAAQAEGRSSVLLLIDRAGARSFVPVSLAQS